MRARLHRRNREAFTLIELLASIAILMIIVTMVGVIFTESDRAWTLGTNRSDVNLEGRAALSMLAHDLQYAIAYRNKDPEFTIHYQARRDKLGLQTYGFPNDELCFVSLQNDCSDGYRAAREMFYYVREMTDAPGRFELVRSYYSKQLTDESINANGIPTYQDHCYFSTNWARTRPLGSYARFIARNVSGFAVYSYTDDGNTAYEYNSADPANSNRLPEYVDVCLELLPDRQARQAARLSGQALTNFVSRNAMRYATRVHFHNRDGYKEERYEEQPL